MEVAEVTGTHEMAVLKFFQIPIRTMWWSPFLVKLQT